MIRLFPVHIFELLIRSEELVAFFGDFVGGALCLFQLSLGLRLSVLQLLLQTAGIRVPLREGGSEWRPDFLVVCQPWALKQSNLLRALQ